jgi:DNA (cytosine-5)-methyltransferase 1
MRVLDLYCGAGGAARGLKQAGFDEVVGVDIVEQRRYVGDRFVQMDAVEFLATQDLSKFDFIWASPPCQFGTSLRHAPGKHRNVNLIPSTRAALERAGKPWVIENVDDPCVRKELRNPIMLCGSMFGLETHPYPDGWRLERHRLFETSFPVLAPACQHDGRRVVGIYGGHVRDRQRPTGTNHKPNSNVPTKLGYVAMGIPFGSMTTAEISDAIPPAYSKFVAEQWLRSRPPHPKQPKEQRNMNTSAFREMAAAMRSKIGFDGIMLLFKKGRWTAGKDAIEMNDEELVALVDQSMLGWCKWEDRKPVDYHVGFVRDRYKPPKRSELGANDSSRWEKRDIDPWQFTFFLPLADPDGSLYIFSTTSRGGRDALADLQEAYADHEERDAGKAPRVALSVGRYRHPSFGEVETPVFKIINWVDPPAIRPIRPPASLSLAIAQPAAIEHKRSEVDDADDIPF